MTSTLLANELANLVSEAKRRNSDLKTAADKSLQELKSLPSTSEQQLAADLSRRPAFVEAFILACGTRVAKLATSGVTCLQRLIVTRGLPKTRLQDAVESFNACTNLGLDVQLKILQALPSLLQNYSEDLRGELLSAALEVCSSLQSAKAQTVSGVAAATLQQLISSIFEKVAIEDEDVTNASAANEIHLDDRTIRVGPAAYDAYRVLRDLSLAVEDSETQFVQFASLSRESALELIWICLNANPQLFASHDELSSIVIYDILASITSALSEKSSFPVTLRSYRILDLVLGRYIPRYPAECLPAISLVTQNLDGDASNPWKRALAMEALRNFFVDGNHVIDAYAVYDMTEGGKPVVQDLMSAFVRLSSEKPSVIGLGQQSSVPVGIAPVRETIDQLPAEVTAGIGIVGSTFSVAEANVAGISSKWSIPRTPCLDQLDKSEPPPVPETYIYALVLECMGSISDGLAKAVLPLTVHQEKQRSKGKNGHASVNGTTSEDHSGVQRHRSQSYLKRTVPLNPLEQATEEAQRRIQAIRAFVDSCWPAVLATSSTFLNAALDDQYYRNLIKAYQRFAQVAGLLRLSTARDALMTTLGKAAVPSHVLNAALAEPLKSPNPESRPTFTTSKSLLSMETLVSQASALSGDRERRSSLDSSKPMMTTRNLLCLRALLNLAIALGPTLETAFGVIVDTLRQADLVLSTTTPQQLIRRGRVSSQMGSDSQNVAQVFSNEVAAVEAAASRLLESTADYPNDAFLTVLATFCRLLHGNDPNTVASPRTDHVSSPPPTPTMMTRSFSGFTTAREMQMRTFKFVVPKLGNLAELNVARFAEEDTTETGWNLLVDVFISIASDNFNPVEARRAATAALCKLAAELVSEVMEDEVDIRIIVQRRTLAILLRLIDSMYQEDGDLTSNDIEVQSHVLDALQAILQHSGESLVAGWNRTLGIISNVFERNGSPPDRPDDEETHIDWENVSQELASAQLGRTGFAATQLICSDFLSALPTGVMSSLIELLFRFAKQNDDLNISLSTITTTWNVSDFLLSGLDREQLEEAAQRSKEADDLEEEIQSTVRQSMPMQWLLLLLRLQNVIKTGHKEVRKAAFQTMCSIFKNGGHQLTTGTWDLTLRSIILRISSDDVSLYHTDPPGNGDEDQTSLKNESISSTIIAGTAAIVAQNLPQVEAIKQLPSLWEAFLSRLEAYLDLQKPSINAAVFRALSTVLAQISTSSKAWTGPLYRTLALWLKRNPATAEIESQESNQDTLLAYVDAGTELYRLTQQSMSTSQTRTLVENLYLAVRHADGPQYAADKTSMSQLQSRAFDLLKTVRSDQPSTLVVVAAKLATLHHDLEEGSIRADGPTFVAIAGEAMDWLKLLVLSVIQNDEPFENGVVISVLESLQRLITSKYLFGVEYKGIPLWRQAINIALEICGPILSQCQALRLHTAIRASILTELVGIAGGIVSARGLALVSNEDDRIYEDETADIEGFVALKDVLVPYLGDAEVPDQVRQTYTRALFEASIVHETQAGEVPGSDALPLENIGKIRRGRVRRVPFSQRERMCYICFAELINLASRGADDTTAKRTNLAQAAAPLLILRLAIPIRAYIADQPLRGRRPQPLSELEELLYCFEAIEKLRLHPEALRSDAGSLSGENAHLQYLYPFLVEAVGTAGDRWSGADEVLKPLQSVLSRIRPVT